MKQWIRVKKALLLSLILLMAWLLPLFQWNGTVLSAAAISTDYPAQLMHLASKGSTKVLTANGTSDGAALSLQTLGSDLSASWRFDRVGSDGNGTFFKLVNAQSGRLLTPRNYNVSDKTDVILYGSESAQSQHWYVVPVKQDHLGNDLYYKIVNYSDTSLALTQGTSGMTLAKYSGTDNQLWLLNADGLQGFAGYCFDDNTGNIKAGDIGGLFGEIVEVSTFADLKKYATADIPYTIVVTANIRVTALQKDSSGRNYCPDGRIYVHSNKTIIGSYAAHTMYNVQFCTSSNNGTGNNLILKNFELQHDAESNGNDSIVVYLGSGQNIWVDHCTFAGHSDYNTASTGLPDWDKFLACCYDADYTTVSDCSFGLHEYGVILGYPADDDSSYKTYNNYPRMSIISNRFEKTLTRGPGLMRYGYFHSLNNYVKTFSMAYTVHTASKIFAENCYYEDGGNVICDWNTVTYPGSYAETGSKSVNCKRTTIEGYAQDCIWRPTSNYKTISRTADEAKVYCENYSGCQNDRNHMMYLRYAVAGVPSASYTESPSAPLAELFAEGSAYRIRNVNSGLYLQVAGAAAKNGTNVQQWEVNGANCQNWILEPTTDPGCSMNTDVIYTFENAGSGLVMDITDGKMTDNTNVQQWSSNGLNCQKWTLRAFGSGNYYWIRSQQDSHYALKAEGSKNGGNLAIAAWSNKDSTQLFRFTKNLDGSYSILTHASGDSCYVEVADASTANGANVQQWEPTGSSCQKWQTKTETTTVTTKVTTTVTTTTTTKATTNTTTAAATSTTTATATEPPVISGDINADGKTNLADVVLLQKWLLGFPETKLANWQAGDLNADRILNGFDLCLLRNNVI